jgi:hypothetical protein
MVRTIFAVLLGLVVAVATMLLLEFAGMSLFPLPPGTRVDSEADLARVVASASTGKLLWVLMGWAVAAFLGGWVAARLARHRTGAALAVGAVVVAGVVLNAAMLPHPAWMTVAGVLLPLPLAWCASRLVRAPAPPPLT